MENSIARKGDAGPGGAIASCSGVFAFMWPGMGLVSWWWLPSRTFALVDGAFASGGP